jgi:ABC-type transporter Mla MlaB component
MSFNHTDLTAKNTEDLILECKKNLKENVKIHLNLTEAKDINVQNLILLIDLSLTAKKEKISIKFNLSEELKNLFIKSNLEKLFITE